MKARFLALAALVLGLASCQTEPEGLDVNVGGEVDTVVTVSLPETETRAALDSALGVFAENGLIEGDYTIRYIFQVFYKGEESGATRQVIYSDGKSVSFPVRLVPGREYSFVAWADVVPQTGKTLDLLGVYDSSSDYRYNTENLEAVTFKGDEWLAMDETFDAYTDVETIEYNGNTAINLELIRPFAKLRVVTTDMVELGNLRIVPEGVVVNYTVPVYKSFNALGGEVVTTNASTHTFTYNLSEVQEYTTTAANKTLFTNYLFGAENGVVKFDMTVNDNTQSKELIKTNNFNTDIPVQRNYLTTIQGNILTDGNNVKVTVVEDGKFAGETQWPDETKIAEQLAYAAMFGGEVTLTEDIALTQSLTIVEGAKVVINLNGKTITGNWHKGNGHIIENNGTLTIVGGTITSTGDNGGSAVMNSGTLTVNDATLNGAPNANGSWPSYAVNNTGVMTLENTTITSYHGAVASYGDGAVVTLNNCTIDMAGIPGFTSHGIYTYNNGKVVVNGGTYENKATDQSASGASVINGAVTVNAGTFSGRIENYYGTPVIKGGTFSVKPNNNFVAAGYKVIEKDGKFVVVANEVDAVVASKADLKSALTAAAGETEVVIDANGANIGDLNYGLTQAMVPAGTTVTIRNANVEGKSYGNGANGTIIFEGCTFYNSGAYSIHFDNGNGKVIFKNCDLYGWNSFGASLTSVEFENCSLTGNGSYALIRSYVDLTLTNCVINTSSANHNDVYPEGVEVVTPATLTENNVTYVVENPEALKAAIINGGNIEFANDITVDEWVMFSEDLNVATGDIITVKNINVSIDGKGHTLTVNAIESAGNNDQLFQGASVLNISNLTIKYADSLTTGGLGMHSGVIKNVHFIGGGSAASSAAIFPNEGEILVEDCIFDTNGVAFYFEEKRDNLTVTRCTFNQKADKNVILLRGDVKFTNNIINSGRTVNVVSGSPVVTGNNFNNVRFKVYGAATATISNNIINNLEFDGTTYASTFSGNTLSTAAQAALNAVTKVN